MGDELPVVYLAGHGETVIRLWNDAHHVERAG